MSDQYKSRQIVIRKAIESFCKKIEYAPDKSVKRYWPLGKEYNIVVDIKHQFGQPTISGTNIVASVIYSMYECGDAVDLIQMLFDLTKNRYTMQSGFCVRKVA